LARGSFKQIYFNTFPK